MSWQRNRAPRVLVVDDDPGYRMLLGEFLAEDTFATGIAEPSHYRLDVTRASSGEEALEQIRGNTPPDLVLLDMRMPGMGGLGLLEHLAAEDHQTSKPIVIVLTAFAEVDDAVQAMKFGAADYLKKPIDLPELALLVGRQLGLEFKGGDSAESATPSVSLPPLPENAVFSSPVMVDLLDELARLAATDVPVLLTGESGTGKEVLAELLHNWSTRAKEPLVSVNVSALPESLVESELFGSTKGAFTGADRDREGVVRAADKGTLFLDEIGEMPLSMQPKLLRVLESRAVTRIGDSKSTAVDFRLIAATHRDLEADIEAGRFRLDLYYRLAVVTVQIPPLRERREDILPLARNFLVAASNERKELSPQVRELLLAHAWPGNIRELRNAMMRAAILAPGDRVLPEHLPPTLASATPSVAAMGGTPAEGESLAEVERRTILSILERNNGNRTKAAKELGISRRKLLYRLKDYGL